MALYVINQTTLRVRVVAVRIKNEDRIAVILTLPGGRRPKFAPLLDAIVERGVHPKVLVPGARDDLRITIENRAKVATELVKDKNGDRVLFIKSVLN